jgi:hypothetical protein
MIGRLATQAAKDPRVHLVGYGPSTSTIVAGLLGQHAYEVFYGIEGGEVRTA